MVAMDANSWDERYRETDLVWSAGPNGFLPDMVEDLAPGTALDLGCGEGRNAIWLAQKGWSVTGVDFSAVGIEKARTLSGDLNIRWQVDDATTYEASTAFDLVVVFYLHLPPAATRSALRRAAAAVAPGGTFIAVGHAGRNAAEVKGGPPLPEILWSEASFDGALDGFTTLEFGERLRPVDGAETPAIDFVVRAVRTAENENGPRR